MTRSVALAVLAVATAATLQAHALSATGDFDADGHDEILLRHGNSREWIYYDLDAEGATQQELALEMADTVRFIGTGDFDGDGAAEILARDIGDQIWRYFDQSDDGIVERLVPAMTRNDYWSVDAIGDFDGDGKDDVLIRRHDNGASLYYTMEGTRATLVRNIGVTHNTSFDVLGSGDFNGDGHDDILLRHAHNGHWIYYDMAGARGALRRPGLTPNLLFEFEAIGDFNGDGRDDVMLRHMGNGEWIYYAMGASHRGKLMRQFGMPRDLAHRLVAAGDFDGDGDSTPLLRHPHTGSWLSYDLTVSPAERADHPGMTTDLAWAATSEPSFSYRTPQVAHAEALLDGVSEIGAPGAPGPLCVYGPGPFPLVVGATDAGHAPVVAASRWEAGRVVAFGHDGYLSRRALQAADTGLLMTNALHWAAGMAPESPRIGVVAAGELRAWLTEAGHNAVEAALTAESLSAIDVVALRLWDHSEAELEALSAFVRAGGGLVAASTGWGWAGSHADMDLASDYAGNRLLAKVGIGWARGLLKRTSSKGYAVDGLPPELTHAAKALAAVNAHETGKRVLTTPEIIQATASVVSAIRCTAPDDDLLWSDIRALAETYDRWPTEERPLSRTRAVGRIAATFVVESHRRAPAESVGAHPAAVDFPGPVPTDAPRLSRSVIIDTAVPRWHSTGLYAAPGELVTVTMPDEAASAGGFHVRVGAHSDGIWRRPEWTRMPEITRRFPVSAPTTPIANAFGGLIYVEVPPGTAVGRIAVAIEGAVAAPLFVVGQTDADAWRDEIRHAPAPWAEIAGRNMIVTTAAHEVRALDHPAAVATAWDRVLDLSAELATWPSGSRSSPERFVVDRQISVGVMHDGYPLMAHLDQSANLVGAAHLRTEGNWGFFHEVGHNHESGDWTFAGTGEVTVNLFTLYVYEFLCGIPVAEHPRGSPAFRAEQMARYDFDDPDFVQWKREPFLALVMYEQMQQAFGWDAYRRVFAAYRALPHTERPKSDDEKRDQWLVRFSREVGRDLGPFFEAWGIPTSQEARNSIAHLPTWLPEDFPPSTPPVARDSRPSG